MQLQGILFMLFMLAIFPVIILASNHEVFFIIMSLVLCVVSIRKIYGLFFGHTSNDNSADLNKYDNEDYEEIEELLNIDLKELKSYFLLAGSLLTSIFLIYCTFFVTSMFVKYIILSIVLCNIYDIITRIGYKKHFTRIPWIINVQIFLVNACTLLTVMIVVYNKYIKNKL